MLAVPAAGAYRRAGATYELMAHLLSLVARRRHVLLTVGWIIADTG
jgi:hypothetical protein